MPPIILGNFIMMGVRIGKSSGNERGIMLQRSWALVGRFLLLTLFFIDHSFDIEAQPSAPLEDGLGNEVATLSDGGAFGNPDRSFRQEFCLRYKEMIDTKSMNVANALSGTEIHLSLVPGPYFIYDDITGIDPNYPGINALILDYIANRGNFTWRTSFGVWTREEKGNSSITDILVWGTEKYDMMIGTYTPSTERMKLGVSFVDGQFDGTLIMVRDVPPPVTEINWFNWLRPFETSVWIGLITVVILSSFAYQLIEAIGGTRHEHHGDGSFRSWVMSNLYFSFLNFTANYSYEPSTLGGRVFGVFFAFWAMLISAAYTANLASLLVTRATPELVVQDIQDAIDQRLSICVHQTSYSENYLKERYPGIEPLMVLRPFSAMYDALNQNECEIMVAYKQDFEVSLKRQATNPRCSLQWQGRQIQPLVDGFATKLDPGIKCTDLVNEVFNFYIKEMTDNGILDEMWKEHTDYFSDEGHCDATFDDANANSRRLSASSARASQTQKPSEDDEDSNALSLKDMAGTLLFQVGASAMAILVAFLSGCEPKTKNKRRVRRKTTAGYGTEPDTKIDCIDSVENMKFREPGECLNEIMVHEELAELKLKMGELMAAMQRIQEGIENKDSGQFRSISSLTTGTFEPKSENTKYLSNLLHNQS